MISGCVATPADPPSQGKAGDGLTAFEEFRGFMVRGMHTRMDPTIKDLFVASTVRNVTTNARYGLGFATEAQGLPMRVHHIFGEDDPEGPEYSANRIINASGQGLPGHFGQRALRVKNEFILGPYGGMHYPLRLPSGAWDCPNGGSTPNETDYIGVDTVFFQEGAPGGPHPQQTVDHNIGRAIAHEVGHGLHVNHRGGAVPPPGCSDSADPGSGDSVMSSGFVIGLLPGWDHARYNNKDREQMRLHAR
jgi:hypothetical protein